MRARFVALVPSAATLAFAAALSVIAGAALAADLPSQAAVASIEEEGEPPPPMPVFSWGGAYAGLHAGYAFGQDHAALRAPFAGTAARAFFADGITGGGHVGYNVVTAVSAEKPVGVFGVEADVDGSSYGRRSHGVTALPGGTGYSFTPAISDAKSPVAGSVRGRIGIGSRRLLFYGTGGLAVASFSTAIPGATDGRADVTRIGYTLGGGLEYAMTNHVALRAEYRYSDFGSYADPGATTVFPGATLTHRDSVSRLQGGVSYLFADPVAPLSRTD